MGTIALALGQAADLITGFDPRLVRIVALSLSGEPVRGRDGGAARAADRRAIAVAPISRAGRQ